MNNKTNKAKEKIQTAMNTTRTKLGKGKFKEKTFEIVPLTIKNDKLSMTSFALSIFNDSSNCSRYSPVLYDT